MGFLLLNGKSPRTLMRGGFVRLNFGHEKARSGESASAQNARNSGRHPAGGRSQRFREAVLIVGHNPYLASPVDYVKR